MQALILAGGLGTRLKPLTNSIPKCLVTVAGKPFLEHVIARLHVSANVRDIVLAVGYRAEQIQNYFGDGSKCNVRIEYSVENPPRGTGGALDQARQLIQNEFLILNGDNLIEMEYGMLIQKFREHSDWVGALSLYSDPTSKFSKNVFWDGKTPQINEYSYGSDQDKNYVDAGVKIFRKSILDYLPNKREFSLEKDILPSLARKRQLGAFPITQCPLEIGNLEQLRETENYLGCGSKS